MSDVLSGKVREKTGKTATKEVRRKDEIPAVLYGLKDNLSLSICPNSLDTILSAKGQNALIDLDVDGDKQRKVIIKEYQSHPLRETWVHVDFLEVDVTKAVKVSVVVNLIGKSAGEKMGGLVNQVTKSLNVECLPADIPESVDVDMTNVELGQVIHMSDLNLSDKIKVLHRPTEAIVSVYLEKVKEEKAEEEEGAEGEAAAEGDEPAAKEESPKKEG
ncbi:MAG: 50S ribosomal protein L25 [Nitrospinaceae bacterium]|jgi:large subunit ribosomal protein L25|nr:50S ribosomal protein L25 [Nitrospinaceae bacterium]MDP6657533.1 50S ribosomal protein L25 [Nitrospinaceae bacterium]MDP6712177.1 50S ribosomal protein L25 [Nitrospinaceae bacterium]MDP7057584.1 50S ribosomal protein L25 [Nitrospinaceae bacterium]HAK37196.1 50S ribosomal protein L25 [Nitrospina sp.]|tara:strand:- start:3779 stop:4429 length:651 start_codon:yes stop_codon:yes gene_type:complete